MSGETTVRRLEPARREELRQLLLSDPSSMVYGTAEFLGFLEEVTGGGATCLGAFRDGALVGALPYLTLSAGGERVVNSLPWYGSYGGCLTTDTGVRQLLLEQLRADLAQLDPLSATVILAPHEEEHYGLYASILEPRASDDRIGQLTPLPRPEQDVPEALERLFGQKTRNLVRKARRQGFEELVTDEDWAWRYLADVHARSMAAIGARPKPLEHFLALRRHLPAEWVRLSLALSEGRPVAALLLILFNRTVEYVTPAAEVEVRSRQPLSFLIWEAMLAAVRGRHELWNWGGTWRSQVSLHHFKAGFGALDRPYSYLVITPEGAGERLREQREELVRRFPYFYLYPFDEAR